MSHFCSFGGDEPTPGGPGTTPGGPKRPVIRREAVPRRTPGAPLQGQGTDSQLQLQDPIVVRASSTDSSDSIDGPTDLELRLQDVVKHPPECTAIITGGNSGLGLACAKVLAKARRPAWHIIIATRSSERGKKAAEEIVNETGNPYIEFSSLDLASLRSVRNFAKQMAKRYGLVVDGEVSTSSTSSASSSSSGTTSSSPSSNSHHAQQKPPPPLKAVILNAGVQVTTPTPPTEDGFELTWQANHLGHFLLVNLLIANGVIPLHPPSFSSPLSSLSPYALRALRIIFVASGTHDPKKNTGMPAPIYPPLNFRGRGGAYILAHSGSNSSSATSSARGLDFGGDPISEMANGDPTKEGHLRYTTSKLCNVICSYELTRRLQRYYSTTTSTHHTTLSLSEDVSGQGEGRKRAVEAGEGETPKKEERELYPSTLSPRGVSSSSSSHSKSHAYSHRAEGPPPSSPHISVLAFDPGLMPGTGLARDYSPFLQFLWNYILPVATLIVPNVNTTARSGEALARLASDPKLEGVTSKYYEGFREIRSSDNSYAEDLGNDLWEVSVELAGLTPEEVVLP